MKYLVWRNGRPRWSPGPNLRARGFKGMDLRHESGEWMRLGDAMKKAKELNDLADIQSDIPNDIAEQEAAVSTRRQHANGYVYFLFAEQRLKVGFSLSPLTRARNVRTASAMVVDMFCYVPGTVADEKAIHAALHDYHIDGEWFFASAHAINLVLRCIKQRRAVADTSPI